MSDTKSVASSGKRSAPSVKHVDDEVDSEGEVRGKRQRRDTLASGLPADASGTRCTICYKNYKASFLVNNGSRVSPQMRCKPCHASARALDRAADSQGAEAKKKLSHNKRWRFENYRKDVLAFRVRCAEDDDHSDFEVQSQVRFRDGGHFLDASQPSPPCVRKQALGRMGRAGRQPLSFGSGGRRAAAPWTFKAGAYRANRCRVR